MSASPSPSHITISSGTPEPRYPVAYLPPPSIVLPPNFHLSDLPEFRSYVLEALERHDNDARVADPVLDIIGTFLQDDFDIPNWEDPILEDRRAFDQNELARFDAVTSLALMSPAPRCACILTTNAFADPQYERRRPREPRAQSSSRCDAPRRSEHARSCAKCRERATLVLTQAAVTCDVSPARARASRSPRSPTTTHLPTATHSEDSSDQLEARARCTSPSPRRPTSSPFPSLQPLKKYFRTFSIPLGPLRYHLVSVYLR